MHGKVIQLKKQGTAMKSILTSQCIKLIFFSTTIIASQTTPAAEYAVGEVISLTGANARGGNGMAEGIKVAEEIFNRRAGKTKIKLITIDDESSPGKAVAAVEKLVGQKVVAITGGATSDIVGPASNTAEKSNIVFMTSGGTSAQFVEQGYKNFFRINNTEGYTKAMIGVLSAMNVKTLSVVYSTKKSTNELAQEMQKAMSAKGVKVVMHPFDASIVDFKPLINKIKIQDKPDAINMLGYENDYVGILRAAKVLQPSVKALVGVWQLTTAKMYTDFPELVNHTYGTEMLPYPAVFTSEEGKNFEATFQRLYKKSPDYLSEYGFVQGILLFEAVERAGKNGAIQGNSVREELRKTNRETLIGKVEFDEHGDNRHFQQNIGQHQNGKIVIVWPKENSSGKMEFPAVPW